MGKDSKEYKEADSLLKSAESSIKGFLFFKSPDYLEGADSFSKAGDIFLSIAIFDKSVYCYEKAAMCYSKENLCLKAGQSYKNAADALLKWILSQDGDKFGGVLTFLERCKEAYLEGDNPLPFIRSCNDIIHKLGTVDVDLVLQIYNLCLSTVEQYEKYVYGKEMFIDNAVYALLNVSDIKVSVDAWRRAVNAFTKNENYLTASMCILSVIALYCKNNDFVNAERVYKESLANDWFVKSDYIDLCDWLIRGCKERDMEYIDKIKKGPIFQFVNTEIQKIIASFKYAAKGTETSKEEQNKHNDNDHEEDLGALL